MNELTVGMRVPVIHGAHVVPAVGFSATTWSADLPCFFSASTLSRTATSISRNAADPI